MYYFRQNWLSAITALSPSRAPHNATEGEMFLKAYVLEVFDD